MASSDGRRERQVLRLLGQAQQEAQSGQIATAMRLQGEAIDLCRALAERYPDDPRHPLSIASALYALAGMLTPADRPSDAIEALDESEHLYRSISGSAGLPDTAPLIADIAARRALALAADGRGASAVPEAETAVTTYEQLAGADIQNPLQRDLARVYADNARVLARFGDPDVAVASADRAVRIYLSRRPAAGKFAIPQQEVGYLVLAASVAATIHARHGRVAVALIPAMLALQFVGNPAGLQSLHSVSGRVDLMSSAARAAFSQQVAAALRRTFESGARTPSRQADPSADVTTVVDAITILGRRAGYATPAPGGAGLTTLAGALARTGNDDLSTDITRPPLDCAISTPAGRCSPQMAPLHALRLAELAISVLPGAPADGIRIGLEAHYLYAAASRRQVVAMRYQFAEFGPAWARVLLACSAAFEQQGDLKMALDLASWAAGTAHELAPFMPMDSGLAPLVRQCVERHGRMLMATGDRQGGQAALAAAGSMGDGAAPGIAPTT